MPLFSIVIPTYNRSGFLNRAIDSVLSQSFTDYELIIVDDGSTDNTSGILKNYGDKILSFYQENRGVSAARNNGIEKSKGRYIALLDSDDTWHENKLTRHFEFIQSNSDIKIHQTEDIWIRDGKIINPAKKHLKKEGDIFRDSLDLCMVSPSSVVMSREIFEIYGYFDESLKACEDYDLWIRITPFEKIGLIKEKLITRYAGHEDQLSFKYWGMDRFRLYSMIKLLTEKKQSLNDDQIKILEQAIQKKTEILKAGASKHGNIALLNTLNSVSYFFNEKARIPENLTALLK